MVDGKIQTIYIYIFDLHVSQMMCLLVWKEVIWNGVTTQDDQVTIGGGDLHKICTLVDAWLEIV